MISKIKEQQIALYNADNIPNGHLLYWELTKWVHKNYPVLTGISDDFKSAVEKELGEIAQRVINREYHIDSPLLDVPVYFHRYITLHNDILEIKVQWNGYESAFIRISVNLTKPLEELYLDWHIKDKPEDIR